MQNIPKTDSIPKMIEGFKHGWIRGTDANGYWLMGIAVPPSLCLEESEVVEGPAHVRGRSTNDSSKKTSERAHTKVLIRVTWANIIKYGQYAMHRTKTMGSYEDYELRVSLHELRQAVARNLKETCAADACVWEQVGSESSVSDIDINIFSDRVDVVKKQIDERVRAWFGNISLDVLFDMNIYVSAFCRKEVASKGTKTGRLSGAYIQRFPSLSGENYVYVIPPVKMNAYIESQRAWAVLHLYQESLGTLFHDKIGKALGKKGYGDIWTKARSLYERVKDAGVDINTEVQKAHVIHIKLDGISEPTKHGDALAMQYMDIISLIQFNSRETYYSRGAYFHVVMSLANAVNVRITAQEYIDSVFDNLAFVAELCHMNSSCPVQYSDLVGKISKYVFRICSAFTQLHIRSDATLLNLKECANELNRARKVLNPSVERIDELLGRLHELLRLPTSGMYADSYSDTELGRLFEAVLRFVIKRLPVYGSDAVTNASVSKASSYSSCNGSTCRGERTQTPRTSKKHIVHDII